VQVLISVWCLGTFGVLTQKMPFGKEVRIFEILRTLKNLVVGV